MLFDLKNFIQNIYSYWDINEHQEAWVPKAWIDVLMYLKMNWKFPARFVKPSDWARAFKFVQEYIFEVSLTFFLVENHHRNLTTLRMPVMSFTLLSVFFLMLKQIFTVSLQTYTQRKKSLIQTQNLCSIVYTDKLCSIHAC
jgi:hypothetical protein